MALALAVGGGGGGRAGAREGIGREQAESSGPHAGAV